MFKTILAESEGFLEEKKSKFIAHLRPVTSEEEAVAFINEMKKKYYDARHNCSAFVIGEDASLTRCSDDGEPSSTAGRPMLEVLLNKNLTNVCIVVTRYFGGTLLGTGGLVRAYQGALNDAINNAVIYCKEKGVKISITCDYGILGKLTYLFEKNGYNVLSRDFTDIVNFVLCVNINDKDNVIAEIIKETDGKINPEVVEECIYAVIDGEIKIY